MCNVPCELCGDADGCDFYKKRCKMKIQTYDDFCIFFGDYPRQENIVYTKSCNSLDKPGYRGKGYQVIYEREEWKPEYLKSCMSVIFKSASGQQDPQDNDWIVGLIINEIANIHNDYYQKLTDEEWFQENINPDYSCVSDLYADYNYDEEKWYNEIQSGEYENYMAYIHHLAEDFVNYLKQEK